MWKFSFAVASFFFSSHAFSAACCGGGSSFPTVITGDNQSILSFSSSTSSVIGDVDPDGVSTFRRTENKESKNTFTFSAATMVSDEWQLGASVPLIHKSRSIDQTQSGKTGVGDIELFTAYEFLPEAPYSAWKPRAFFYGRVSAPTSPSIYNYRDKLSTDARGSGFWQLSVGTLFTKTLSAYWDAQFMVDVTQGIAQTFRENNQVTVVSPGTELRLLVGAGYSPGFLSGARLGFSLSPKFSAPKTVNNVPTPNESVWDSTLALSYLFSPEWSGSFSYTDQTWFGPAKNTTLSRTYALLVQKRWML